MRRGQSKCYRNPLGPNLWWHRGHSPTHHTTDKTWLRLRTHRNFFYDGPFRCLSRHYGIIGRLLQHIHWLWNWRSNHWCSSNEGWFRGKWKRLLGNSRCPTSEATAAAGDAINTPRAERDITFARHFCFSIRDVDEMLATLEQRSAERYRRQ